TDSPLTAMRAIEAFCFGVYDFFILPLYQIHLIWLSRFASPLYLSPFKISLRTHWHPKNPGNLDLSRLNDFVFILVDLIEENRLKFDFVCGLPHAGEPFARIISWISGKPLLRLEKVEKDDGKREIGDMISHIPFKDNQAVLIVDDLISKGRTKDEGVSKIISAGLKAILCVCIDREEGGSKRYKKIGIPFFAGLTAREILGLGFIEGRISPAEYFSCTEYLMGSKKSY
ncbi:MAG: phosphoribosyltransferase, partial [Candidatus Moranbacteria bacterium]|nr:phosphoribosyltransferase [Candidatus Moranbacteria bacterium]